MDNKLIISVASSSAVNFALSQNHVPIIRELKVSNTTNEDLSNISLTITTDPEFSKPLTKNISIVPAQSEYIVSDTDIPVSPSLLFGFSEGFTGLIHITAECGGEVISEKSVEIPVLAFDQWSGSLYMPEITAAFVTPGSPCIAQIIKNASEYLNKWTGSPAFTGYQSNNPNTVLTQIAAIFAAISKESISYCLPPASFEEIGQRIRLCETVISQKLGTCMDMTLLFASCLEFVRLNTILVFLDGHIFPAVWLIDSSFPECVQDDPTLLLKRAAKGINEICLVEATALCKGSGMDFESACEAAERGLREKDSFQYFLDIKRSRIGKIRPLPVLRNNENGEMISDSFFKLETVGFKAPPELVVTEKLQEVESVNATKQQVWERKLLDLSLRNPLLNFRVTKNSLQLLTDSLSELEDALSCGEDFHLSGRPAEMENTVRSGSLFEADTGKSLYSELIKSEFKSKRIRTCLDDETTSLSIINLFRTARTAMENNGANTLFLALGFLKWRENEHSEKDRYAPIVLIPVDIIRKSALKGYVIRMRDEEPQMNITLLEMLRVNYGITIGGLDPLPLDEHGVDISNVFGIIRQAVMSKPYWDVCESAVIGIFSFSQFIMWNDIRNRAEDLRRNKIVSSLISGHMTWEQENDFLEPEQLDINVLPLKTALPVSSDSSQLIAIHAAAEGNSFVLHGPPGTGKSQTITNMISNALYNGKSVLFIADKMAALSVVQKRLDAVGLSPFCLELHSNKAKKKDVLCQLEKTINLGKIKPPEEYEKLADKLLSARMELNELVGKLHKKRTFGFSLYQAVSMAEKFRDYSGLVSFNRNDIEKLTPEKYGEWCGLTSKMETAMSICGDIPTHPLSEFSNANYSQGIKSEIFDQIEKYQSLLLQIKQYADILCKKVQTEFPSTYTELKAFSEMLIELSEIDFMPKALFESNELKLIGERTIALCKTGVQRDEAEKQIAELFVADALSLNAAQLLSQWRQAQASWFLPKMLDSGKIHKTLKSIFKNPQSYDKSKAPAYLELICQYQEKNNAVIAQSNYYSALFGVIWNGGKPDWTKISFLYQKAVGIREKLALLKEISPGLAKENISNILSDTSQFKAEYSQTISELNRSLIEANKLEASLAELTCADFSKLKGLSHWIFSMSEKLSAWANALDKLRDWSSFVAIRDEMINGGLTSLIDSINSGSVTAETLSPVFFRGLSQACALYVTETDPSLSSFNGIMFEKIITTYKDMINKFRDLTKQELAARLSAKLPTASAGVSGSSEIGILQRAIKSGGRMLSIRKLFDSIPNLLRRTSPCMLMSPISVAQYIDPSFPNFDLVIFDEASQLPTCRAVGAIARGDNLVVVGDPKQLPPTSFFTMNQTDEENFETEDLESILDDCLALSMPQKHLLWHYRSRHESLISFSNSQYYENKLFTFPSPNDLQSKVKLVQIEGCYDRGKTKQNKAEATAVINEIERRLDNEELRKMSVGVVTFSQVQQSLIEDMLDAKFRERPELEEIMNAMYEPIFVKNLENVQGDERDVILFSVGYGPDKDGNVTLNFGPLNRDGGWKRLNVAVSRARYEMIVFSVLRPEQIDLSRTRSEGVAGLKAFMEFASRGKQPADTLKSIGSNDGFVQLVAEKLRSLGYKAVTGVGCSGFKLDIGVVNPRNHEEYLIGLICDGNNYNTPGTAHDRNILRESVLSSLGWIIHHVWSLDWWDNPDKELSRIVESIDNALSNHNSSIKVKAPVINERKETSYNSYEVMNEEAYEAKKYKVAKLEPVSPSGSPDLFADAKNRVLIKKQIEQIITEEAPVSKDIIQKRVLSAWGITRSGARIDRVFNEILGLVKSITTSYGETVFYFGSKQPEITDAFRIPTDDNDTKRSFADIEPHEIAGAVKYVLDNQLSLTPDDLAKEVAKLFGYSKCTASMREYIDKGTSIASESGIITATPDRIVLNNS